MAAPTALRTAFWLGSVGIHAAVFAASGHVPGARGVEAPFEVSAIDLEANPAVVPVEPAPALDQVRVTPFVPHIGHTHPYPVALDHDAHPHDPSLVHLPLAPAAAPREPPASEAIAAATAPAPLFALAITNGAPEPSQASAVRPGADRQPEQGSDAAPLPEDGVSSPARLVGSISPAYPSEARAQEVEADVVLALVVTQAGVVADARVVRSAGAGFDQAALNAARRALFTPALRDGRHVAVRMRWTVSFRLR